MLAEDLVNAAALAMHGEPIGISDETTHVECGECQIRARICVEATLRTYADRDSIHRPQIHELADCVAQLPLP